MYAYVCAYVYVCVLMCANVFSLSNAVLTSSCAQVGVVGDGSTAMENFDNREVISSAPSGPAAGIGGREEGTAGKFGASGGNRVDKRWNAWGSDSTDNTFKDRLKEEGVVDIDIYGSLSLLLLPGVFLQIASAVEMCHI